jgi:hypothetical protein
MKGRDEGHMVHTGGFQDRSGSKRTTEFGRIVLKNLALK